MNENPSPPPTISVVVPVHCEAAILATALREIGAALEPLALGYEIVVIDDGSTDATWSVIAQCAASERRLRAICLSRRFGKEAAVCAGLELARGAATIVMDGDLQHPPALIPAMVGAWRNGAEIVEGVARFRLTGISLSWGGRT
jgi:glycosyltransferase involved in cell wall biosynthesis